MKIEFEVIDFPKGEEAELWLIPSKHKLSRIIFWLLIKIGAKTGLITKLS
jgi:hypothetical protein